MNNGIQPIGSAQDRSVPLGEQVKELGRDISHKATSVAQDAKRVAEEGVAQVGSVARSIAHEARDKVEHVVDDKKSAGADYLGSLARSVGRAAGEFDDSVPQVATYIRQASDQLQHVADAVRGRDVRDLVGEVENFARRQPALFFGGAVILGFAALRFFKSASSGTRTTQAYQNPSNGSASSDAGYASRNAV